MPQSSYRRSHLPASPNKREIKPKQVTQRQLIAHYESAITDTLDRIVYYTDHTEDDPFRREREADKRWLLGILKTLLVDLEEIKAFHLVTKVYWSNSRYDYFLREATKPSDIPILPAEFWVDCKHCKKRSIRTCANWVSARSVKHCDGCAAEKTRLWEENNRRVEEERKNLPGRLNQLQKDGREYEKQWKRSRKSSEKRKKSDPDEVSRLKWMPYEEYLETDHWKAVRDGALRRAEYRCQLCNSSGPLDVHHRTYENRGCEHPADVIALCRTCHEKHHGKEFARGV